MRKKPSAPESVDVYISEFPAATQEVLRRLRSVIRKAAPEAEEKISYSMPAFALNGILVWYAAHRNHIGFYPKTSAIAVFKRELSKYNLSRGTVQFPLGKPLPYGLVARIVKFRVAENLAPKVKAKEKARGGTGKP